MKVFRPSKAVSRCIFCREEIQPSATKCTKCGSFQSAWKNRLQYVAGIVGLFSAGAAALAFAASQSVEIRKLLFWQDKVALISFRADSQITVANVGDGPIHVARIEVASWTETSGSNGLGTSAASIGIELAPGAVKAHRFSAPPGHRDEGGLLVASWKGREDWLEKLRQSGYRDEFMRGEKCYLRMVSYEGDGSLKILKERMGEHFGTYPAQAEIVFYSIKSGDWHRQRFDLTGFLGEHPNRPCKK